MTEPEVSSLRALKGPAQPKGTQNVLTSQSIQTRGASVRVSAIVDEAKVLFRLGVGDASIQM